MKPNFLKQGPGFYISQILKIHYFEFQEICPLHQHHVMYYQSWVRAQCPAVSAPQIWVLGESASGMGQAT